MFNEEMIRNNAELFIEIEQINNGFVVTSVKGKVHCRTFNGLVRALEAFYKTKLIATEEKYETVDN